MSELDQRIAEALSVPTCAHDVALTDDCDECKAAATGATCPCCCCEATRQGVGCATHDPPIAEVIAALIPCGTPTFHELRICSCVYPREVSQ